ncbi:hypothetical protein KR018_000316 [Drosophila ironensis]|nr:hypothetical protein KR018_000316 [Drosophila ironensis]
MSRLSMKPSILSSGSLIRRSAEKQAFSKRYTAIMEVPLYRYTRVTIGLATNPYEDVHALIGMRRHPMDQQFVTDFDETVPADFYYTYTPKHDYRDALPKDPKYTRFKIPTDVWCRVMLKENHKKYNDQINKEIAKLIEYQTKATDAAYFVRMMAYTTLWPPYHSNQEINNTSRTFYKLSKKEQQRYDYIMSHDLM